MSKRLKIFIAKLKMSVKKVEWFKKLYRKFAKLVSDMQAKSVVSYLEKKYGHIAESNNENCYAGAGNEQLYIVWICWWQGEDNMPELVKMCYHRLLKNANGHKVNLITKDNYAKFVEIPDFITKKIEKQISLTHLSDILRFALVNKFGGLYVDATVFVTNSLPDLSNIAFFTNKWENMQSPNWTGYCFYSSANNVFTNTILQMFFEYWKTEKRLMHFFLIDLFAIVAIKKNRDIANMINKVPILPITTHALFPILNKEFNMPNFHEICSKSYFQKLTYKDVFYRYTNHKQLTYYGYLMQEYERGKDG